MTPTTNLNLKAALLRRGVAQYKLAQTIGCTETRMSRIVSGRIDPTSEERAKIARALGVQEAGLFESAR